MKKSIVIFGGSFNPPLNSHFSIAQQVLNQFEEVEKIVFIPVNKQYPKDGLLNNEHRYNMLKLVADKFEVPLLKADLTDTYKTLEKELDQIVKPKDEAKINAKPRLRMTTLYYVAQSLDYLVIGTGNKCEAVVGYTTKWGDNAHDFNPIGDFTVEEVLQIGEYLGVPDKIIKKAPNDGLGGLTDEQKLGVTYKQIAEYIETGETEESAMEIIKRKEKVAMHKRMPIPVYKRIYHGDGVNGKNINIH